MFESLSEYYKGAAYKWDDDTIWLYIAIIVITSFLSFFAQSKFITCYRDPRNREVRKSQLSLALIFASFVILWLFMAFRDVGVDLNMYRRIYEKPDDYLYVRTGFEPGYMFLNKMLHYIFPDALVGICIISLLSVYFQYRAVIDNSGKISVGLAVLAIGCMFYLQSYNLVRIYLAANILLWASKYIFAGKYGKYAIINGLTVLIHFSSLLVFIPFLLFLCWRKNKFWFWVVFALLLFIGYSSLSILSMIPIFSRYVGYLEKGMMRNEIGMMQYAINLPLILLWLYARRVLPASKYLDMLLTYTLAALFIGVMSYKVEMLGRSLVYFNVVYVLCVPYVVWQLRKRREVAAIAIGWTYAAYLFVRLYLYFTEYMYLDGIMPYKHVVL